MSDERDVADDAATDSDDAQDDGGRTAVVTKTVARPQRPTGKRSRQRPAEVGEDADETVEAEAAKSSSAKESSKAGKAKAAQKTKKAKKAGKPGARPNPIAFVYNYLKQVVAEMRKVIWPNRKQMLTYTSVVLVFLAFMTALVAGADLGLSKLVLLVFGGS
ncbi:preprotein translocase subunit SecE [Mycobacterium intermedium]|uniref:Protein translocase subunit SecE n=1 Tax=Mycobacterium intermedium TaxID=28445 RepID=A0A1E3SA82_MYCIE|nr:preprotein translocase subunit SecE [Mycobacterium intermedium]MCV6962459.1 preprotein translocase subunit SecE [Mycobacterium intermedium]ODQ98971.1 preprotein translocase subunit SecE [Mycobacterium intermedium]OPE51219.1 preprotein translocase subunit SecE [Mycobacterium intermedium]ORB04821.1 preprotein translocase subunit SecE [Mycobacterium intermedium]